MSEAFDDLAKALASGMSRREALRRFGIAAFGGLAFLYPARARAAPASAAGKGTFTACVDFCAFVYHPGTNAYYKCVRDAKDDKGLCKEFGPASAPCRGVQCPPHSFCVSNTFNFNFNSTGLPGHHCAPFK